MAGDSLTAAGLRVRWFSAGLQSADLKSCDIFDAVRP
jgi:predicted metalloprotease